MTLWSIPLNSMTLMTMYMLGSSMKRKSFWPQPGPHPKPNAKPFLIWKAQDRCIVCSEQLSLLQVPILLVAILNMCLTNRLMEHSDKACA